MAMVNTRMNVIVSVNPQVRRCIALVCAVIQDRGRSLSAESVVEEKASVFDTWIAGDDEEKQTLG